MLKKIYDSLEGEKAFVNLDLGLRNAILNNFIEFDSRTDGGALLENFVFRELFTSNREG